MIAAHELDPLDVPDDGDPRFHGGDSVAWQRRGWDSNPRGTQGPLTVFETAPFNHSGTPPGHGQG